MNESMITEQCLNSLEKYFKTLEESGYMNYSAVYDLLAFLLMEEFINTEINLFMTEEDYRDINRLMYCIYERSCLFPYPESKDIITSMGTILPDLYDKNTLRTTEEEKLRLTEDNLYRVMS